MGLRTRPPFHGQLHCHFLLKKNPPLSHRLAVLVWTDTGLEPGHTTPNGNQGENAVYVHWVLDSQGSLMTTIVSPVGKACQRVRTAQGRAGLRDGPRVTVLKPVPQPRSSGFSPLQSKSPQEHIQLPSFCPSKPWAWPSLPGATSHTFLGPGMNNLQEPGHGNPGLPFTPCNSH